MQFQLYKKQRHLAIQLQLVKIEFLNGEFKKILNLQKSKECNSKISDIDLTMQIIKQDLLEEYDFLDQERQAFDMQDDDEDA